MTPAEVTQIAFKLEPCGHPMVRHAVAMLRGGAFARCSTVEFFTNLVYLMSDAQDHMYGQAGALARSNSPIILESKSNPTPTPGGGDHADSSAQDGG